jgi:AAA+ ATPase superfamily predicted ATPase
MLPERRQKPLKNLFFEKKSNYKNKHLIHKNAFSSHACFSKQAKQTQHTQT